MCVNCWRDDLLAMAERIKNAYHDDDQNWAIDPSCAGPQLDATIDVLKECLALNQQLPEKSRY